MRTKKIFVLAILTFCLLLTGCGATVEEKKTSSSKSMFVLVEKTDSWHVVYHKDTKVMYAVSMGGYNRGTFTVLVDTKGKPMLWEES